MRGTDPPIFRPTLWPGPLHRNTAVRYGLETPVDGLALHTSRAENVEIPADFSIQEVLVPDAANQEQVFGFMREWGLLCRFGLDCLDSLPVIEREDLMEHLLRTTDAKDTDYPRHDREGFAVPRPATDYQYYLREGFAVSLPAAGWHLMTLQAAARHVIAHLDDDEEAVCAAWTGWGTAWGYERNPETAHDAWLVWQSYNTAALRPFQAHVRLEDDDPHVVRALPTPTTYELAQLQLAEIVTGQSGPLPRCANQRCGLPFVRHRGRSKYDGTHHSTGVKYCSHRCAKAQSERDRRARRKAARQ
jgi:hypothetical protein